MERENPIRDKSYAFALSSIRFHKQLMLRKEFVLGKQFLKSGTSIRANVEEAIHAQSRKDFISKLSISFKEAHETRYWLRLFRDSGVATPAEVKDLLSDINEIISLLTSIIKTSKEAVAT